MVVVFGCGSSSVVVSSSNPSKFFHHTLFSDNCCCTLTSSFFSCRLNDVNWLKTSMSAVVDEGLDRRPMGKIFT